MGRLYYENEIGTTCRFCG